MAKVSTNLSLDADLKREAQAVFKRTAVFVLPVVVVR